MSQSKRDPNTFEVAVHDSVGITEQHPGGRQQSPARHRDEILQKIRERQVELVQYYVKPHNKKARPVGEKDIPRVIKDGMRMAEMCLVGRGDYTLADALAHTQVDDQDPLRFFVYRTTNQKGEPDMFLFINPVIVGTSGTPVGELEGCMSFPEEPMKTVFRYPQVKLRFQTLAHRVNKRDGEPKADTQPYLTPFVDQYFRGMNARMVQHECAHLNGSNIYDKEHSILACEGGMDIRLDKKT